MSRNPLGWSYPAGAENDPNAPWNIEDPERCERCDETFEEFDDDGRPEERSCGCKFCEECDEVLPLDADPDAYLCEGCYQSECEASFERSQNSFDGYNEN